MAGERRGYRERFNGQGQTVIEYILVLVLIALALIIAFRSANIHDAVNSQGAVVQNSLLNTE